MGDHGVLIVGGGLAAQRCAETLRRRGYEGPVRILGAESEAPYDRPPLSKEVLAGRMGPEQTAFRGSDWYEDNAVELILSRSADRLDTVGRRVELDDGMSLSYGKLLIATGASPRRLGFLEGYGNVHALRTAADAKRLRDELARAARLAVVGAGFIGQEVAATARSAGLEVIVIEALETPLEGVLGAEVGRWFATLHSDQGVELRLGARLEGAVGNGSVEQLVLAGGERVDCDAVVVGVGSVPAAAWLEGSGLDPGGVRTDTAGRTGIPDVFAAGDVACSFDPRFGSHARSEHWDAASWEGAAVARAILGEYPGTPPLPGFWSDQYGLRVHYVGHAHRSDAVYVEGQMSSRDFVAVYTRSGLPVAGLAVGRPRAIPKLRKQIDEAHFPASCKENEKARAA
ncbi:MAG: FAD-dependent oxidoreductase [Solirubrobacterales bacterium]